MLLPPYFFSSWNLHHRYQSVSCVMLHSLILVKFHFLSWEVFDFFYLFPTEVPSCASRLNVGATLAAKRSCFVFYHSKHWNKILTAVSSFEWHEEQRKWYNHYTTHDFGKGFSPSAQFLPSSAVFQCHGVHSATHGTKCIQTLICW